MSKGVNKVFLIGNLGADPKVQDGPFGKIASASLAVSDETYNPVTKEKKEHVNWIQVVFFSGLANLAAQYLRKGSKIFLEGSLKTSQYEGQDGIKRSSIQVVAKDVRFLDAKPQVQQNPMDYPYYPPEPVAQSPIQQPVERRPVQQAQVSSAPEFDDPIPF